ncbi:tripartite tricarboxylate transporter substrate-binding protein [Cupriavidus basilensis]
MPYAPGGTTDDGGAPVCRGLAKALGQTVVVDNKPGVAGTMGALALMQAKPDGYTLSMMPVTVFRQPLHPEDHLRSGTRFHLPLAHHRLHLRRGSAGPIHRGRTGAISCATRVPGRAPSATARRASSARRISP